VPFYPRYASFVEAASSANACRQDVLKWGRILPLPSTAQKSQAGIGRRQIDDDRQFVPC